MIHALASPDIAAEPGRAAAPASRSRPSWSGLLRLSLVTIPVKAYPAVTGQTVSHFHFLHAGCGQRIHYQKHCPQHGPVTNDAIVRGFPYAPGQHVVVEPEELEQLRPAKDKALVLEQFVPIAAIDASFFAGRSLYLWPDGQAAQHPYGVLTSALGQAGKGALARVVLSNQRALVLVRPRGRILVLDLLHYPAQVRDASAWEEELPTTAGTAAELDLAKQLIALASTPLDWRRYRDGSAAELAALVEAKVAQQPPAAAETPLVLHLMDALQKSVAAAQGETAQGPAGVSRHRSARSAKPRPGRSRKTG